MNDWNIQSRSRQCHECEQGFEDQQIYHSLLSSEQGEYSRKDVCETCWQTQFAAASGAAKGFVSHWRGRYLAPPPPPPEAIRKDTAESLLRKLVEKNLPEYAGALYILAVMLERKRVLKVRDQIKKDGSRIFVYEHAKNGDVFTIAEPDLRLDQLEKIQYIVADLMENGLPDEQNDETESEDNKEASGANHSDEAVADGNDPIEPSSQALEESVSHENN
jgi:hypothetical protein